MSLNFISYLRQVVCEDGYRIKRLLMESKTNSRYVGNYYDPAILKFPFCDNSDIKLINYHEKTS
jgi:hypothetical protein